MAMVGLLGTLEEVGFNIRPQVGDGRSRGVRGAGRDRGTAGLGARSQGSSGEVQGAAVQGARRYDLVGPASRTVQARRRLIGCARVHGSAVCARQLLKGGKESCSCTPFLLRRLLPHTRSCCCGSVYPLVAHRCAFGKLRSRPTRCHEHPQLMRIWAGERGAELASAPGLEYRDQAALIAVLYHTQQIEEAHGPPQGGYMAAQGARAGEGGEK